MGKLQAIREECLPDSEKAKSDKGGGDGKKADPFTAAKATIGGELRDIRNLLRERDKQEAENPGSTYTVELAHNVRVALAKVQEDAQRLRAEHDKKRRRYERRAARAKKRDEALDAQMALREEVLTVIGQHIDECSALEKKRYAAAAASSSAAATTTASDPTVTALPDVDDPRFQQLIKTDREIDELVEVLGTNVRVLGEMARDMRDEARAQGQVLDGLSVDVDRADKKLTTLNSRLRKIVETARPGDKFCVDFILIVVLLGLGGLIYAIVKSKF